MDEFIRKVYERGKITIPKELRDLYGVKDGDLVKLRIVKVVQLTDKLREAGVAGEEGVDVELRVRDDDEREVA